MRGVCGGALRVCGGATAFHRTGEERRLGAAGVRSRSPPSTAAPIAFCVNLFTGCGGRRRPGAVRAARDRASCSSSNSGGLNNDISFVLIPMGSPQDSLGLTKDLITLFMKKRRLTT
ncbi:hypothetical protein ACSQ67_000382 [Phaseolus vulgaris]